jgi:tRNA dimethylallyltransferase
MRGIGYREFFGDGGELRPGTEDPIIREEIRQDSRRYAKRQITFFRSLPGVTWHPATAIEELTALVDAFARSPA